MFNRKAKKIKALEYRVVELSREAYSLDQEGGNCVSQLWSAKYKVVRAENERLKEEIKNRVAEGVRVRKELMRIKNRFAHMELSTNELTIKIKRFKNEVIEGNDL